MTLPIVPCHRGPCCPPVAGVLFVAALALGGCDSHVGALADAGVSDVSPRVELIETHSLVRGGVTLGGSVLGPGDAVLTADERPRAW